MRLGITIRRGSNGISLTAPEGTTDLSTFTRNERGTLGRLIAESMGLPEQAPQQHRRAPRRNNQKAR